MSTKTVQSAALSYLERANASAGLLPDARPPPEPVELEGPHQPVAVMRTPLFHGLRGSNLFRPKAAFEDSIGEGGGE